MNCKLSNASAWGKDFVDLGAINYKYQWWLLSDGSYSTWGKDGQYLYVNPYKNLIIVRLGETDEEVPWFKIFQRIAGNIE